MPKKHDIQALLDEIRSEILVASQSFFAWKSIHNIAAKDKCIEKALNKNALSWNIYLHSLQATFFITIGRLFDTDSRSCSIHFLFWYCIKNIDEFSKKSLEKRSIKEAGKKPGYLKDFIKNAYEPSVKDLKNLKKEVTRVQSIYETNFKPVRHKVFAHKDVSHIQDTALLFKSVKIEDVEDILETLYKAENVLRALYVNGHKMNFGYWVLKEEKYILKDTKKLLDKI